MYMLLIISIIPIVLLGIFLNIVLDTFHIGVSGLLSELELGGLAIFSVLPLKPNLCSQIEQINQAKPKDSSSNSSLSKKTRERLSNLQKEAYQLTPKLKEIIVGSTLGDLHIKKGPNLNARLMFEQGSCHSDYIFHLFNTFRDYCSSIGPKPKIRGLSPITGKNYGSIGFQTFALPCFNEFHELFYSEGKKIVPTNIGDLLTPLGLAHLIADDGSFENTHKLVILCTDSFSLEEVTLLANILNAKWDLDCTTIKSTKGQFRIRVPRRSLNVLQNLTKDLMPPMFLYKIGIVENSNS